MLGTYSARAVETLVRDGNLVYFRIGVFHHDGDREEQIGEYLRNFIYQPKAFYPFQRDGKAYALYSPIYTATRIMALPSCRDLGGEAPDSAGFCPVEYYVPRPWTATDAPAVDNYAFGFVGGCYWMGEYHIHYLDLSRASEGIVVRDQRTGYIPWLNNRRVEHHMSLVDYDPPAAPRIALLTATQFNLQTGELSAGDGFEDPQPHETHGQSGATTA
jgi:hypothetical protein